MSYKKTKNTNCTYFNVYTDILGDFPVRMSFEEQKFFIENILNSKNYLEFGSGGSTFLMLLHSQAKITSVESDKNWISYLNTFEIIRENLENRLQFIHINIGETGEWGVPTEPDKNRYKFPNYSKNVFKKSENNFDTIFIDGRFRVASVLQTILNCSSDVKILMHDFINRPYYHILLKFLYIDNFKETLALLKIRDCLNKNDVLKTYNEYKFDFR